MKFVQFLYASFLFLIVFFLRKLNIKVFFKDMLPKITIYTLKFLQKSPSWEYLPLIVLNYSTTLRTSQLLFHNTPDCKKKLKNIFHSFKFTIVVLHDKKTFEMEWKIEEQEAEKNNWRWRKVWRLNGNSFSNTKKRVFFCTNG